MNEYKPMIHDIVFVSKDDMNESLEELGLEVNKEYLVSYIFADGGCVLYEEDAHEKGYIEVSEYILEYDDVRYLSFIYNYMDEGKKKYEVLDSAYDDYIQLDIDDFLDENLVTYDTWVYHNLKVGDYVYFENVELVKFYNEADLQNNVRYKVNSFSEHNNAPIIESPIGEFELYPIEVLYLKLDEDLDELEEMSEEDIKKMIDDLKDFSIFDKVNSNKKGDFKMNKKERETSRVSEKESKSINEMLDGLAFNMAMDKALEEDDFEAAQAINESNDYYKTIAKNSEK